MVNQPQPPSKPIADARAGSDTHAATKERAVLLRGNRLDSSDLFKDARELMIAHGDDIYRLRLTAQNKLILTK
ncbi:MAG: hemin uptake protein HemP [Hyphomicrobiales bacterium]|nr:MAG: hemin uptake protein HemP [Hyphomicrobiales bacterium]